MANKPKKKATSNKPNPLTPGKNAGWMQPVIDRNKKIKASNKFIWTVKSDPSKNPMNNFLSNAKKVADSKNNQKSSAWMKPFLDHQKEVKAGPQKVPFSVKSDPSKNPMNQSNNPLTPKPQQKALEEAKKAKALKDAQNKKKEAAAKKEAERKSAERRKKEAPKVKSTIESLQRGKNKTSPVINPGDTGYVYGKDKNKPKTNTTTKPITKPTPTVSQLWQEKTGTSWSEAKKQGLTDGSANSNTALMKKLQSGSINKDTIKTSKIAGDMSSYKKDMEQNIQDELSGKIKFDEPVPTARKGGMIMKRMKTGGMVNSNARVSAIKKAGSKGVRSGSNTKVSASKVARGRVGGTSAAPRTAVPKAMYGMSMKPGMMRKGGTKKR